VKSGLLRLLSTVTVDGKLKKAQLPRVIDACSDDHLSFYQDAIGSGDRVATVFYFSFYKFAFKIIDGVPEGKPVLKQRCRQELDFM
jgi:hypothetical protein